MDIGEQAEQFEREFLARALAAQAKKSERATMPENGRCALSGCEDAARLGSRFCSKECRDDFEKEERARAIAGR